AAVVPARRVRDTRRRRRNKAHSPRDLLRGADQRGRERSPAAADDVRIRDGDATRADDVSQVVEHWRADAAGAQLVVLTTDRIAAPPGFFQIGAQSIWVRERVRRESGQPGPRYDGVNFGVRQRGEDRLADRRAVQRRAVSHRRARQQPPRRLDRIDVQCPVAVPHGEVNRLSAQVGQLADERRGAVPQFHVDAHALPQRDDRGPQGVSFAIHLLDEAFGDQRFEDVVRGALGNVQTAADLGQRQTRLRAAKQLHDLDGFDNRLNHSNCSTIWNAIRHNRIYFQLTGNTGAMSRGERGAGRQRTEKNIRRWSLLPNDHQGKDTIRARGSII